MVFIKNEEVTKVVITPSERLTKGLQGKGLGNILTVNVPVVVIGPPSKP